jgi:NLR family CARD domain-containing protein 3
MYLSLSKNDIGIQGVTAISEALRVNTSLSSLYFDYNEIGNQGATSIADALKVNSNYHI